MAARGSTTFEGVRSVASFSRPRLASMPVLLEVYLVSV